MIQIEIPLPPVPWQAPIKGKHVFYDPKEKEKRCVRFYIRKQYDAPPLDEFVVIKFIFTFKVPKSAWKKEKEKMLSQEIIPTRSDCTNLQKLYEDCLKGIVIKDDRKVAKIFSEKIYGKTEGIFIEIYTLEEFKHGHFNR